MLRALAHVDRRRLVAECLHEAKTAGDLAAMSSLAAASVSEHLKVLRKCGLVKLDVRGRFWLYRTDATLFRLAVARLKALV